MNHRIRFPVVPLALVLALGVACSRESQQTQPVTTTIENGSSTASASTIENGSSTAPPSKEVEKRGKALVRIVHAIPEGPTIDVFTNDTKTFTNIPYQTITPYQELSDGLDGTATRPGLASPEARPYTGLSNVHITFRVCRLGGQATAEPLVEKTETLTIGNHYTAIALPSTEGKASSLKVVNDDLMPGPSDRARVRFIHASPDAGELDLCVRDRRKVLFRGVNFRSQAGYKQVEPMMATLEVRPSDKENTLATTPNLRWEAGKTYTIIVAGRAKVAPTLVKTITIKDQLGVIIPSS
jgi:hypothetical protein